jgi:phage gpG-like protein
VTAIEYRWIPDPRVLADSIDTVAFAFEDASEPLAAAGETVREGIKNRFETEIDPQGEMWQDWADTYVLWGTPGRKNKGGGVGGRGSKLKDTLDLMRAATSAEAILISNDTVFYRTGHLPEFGLAHETGLPGRTLKGGHPNPLPQRSFLGLSDEDAAVITMYFTEWFEGNIDLYPTSTGKIGRRHAFRAAPGGFFLPRSEIP